MKNEYFIIESLMDGDITDGRIFYDALKKKHDPVYTKVKNPKQFRQALKDFCDSDYRHLFISAHGDEENIILSNGSFNAYDLEDLSIDLSNRRIFMSTCRGSSFLLAKYFIKKGAYSVTGTPDDLSQVVATGMWITMAIVFERLNKDTSNFPELNRTLKLLAKVYRIPLAYYSFIRNRPAKMKGYLYHHNSLRQRSDYPI